MSSILTDNKLHEKKVKVICYWNENIKKSDWILTKCKSGSNISFIFTHTQTKKTLPWNKVASWRETYCPLSESSASVTRAHRHDNDPKNTDKSTQELLEHTLLGNTGLFWNGPLKVLIFYGKKITNALRRRHP